MAKKEDLDLARPREGFRSGVEHGKKQWVRAWHKGGGGRVAAVSPLSATLRPVELDAGLHCPRRGY